MTDITEAVARALAQKDAEDEGLKSPTGPMAYRAYMGLARAAIDAYEKAKDQADTQEWDEATVMGDDGNQYVVKWPKGQSVSIIGVDAVGYGGGE